MADTNFPNTTTLHGIHQALHEAFLKGMMEAPGEALRKAVKEACDGVEKR